MESDLLSKQRVTKKKKNEEQHLRLFFINLFILIFFINLFILIGR